MLAGRYEIRKPKAQGRKKPEFRNSKAQLHLPLDVHGENIRLTQSAVLCEPHPSKVTFSELATSDFFRVSDFGPRILARRSLRTGAFTLVEIMVVVVLIGILTAMII